MFIVALFINCRELETAQISFNWWMDKQTIVDRSVLVIIRLGGGKKEKVCMFVFLNYIFFSPTEEFMV